MYFPSLYSFPSFHRQEVNGYELSDPFLSLVHWASYFADRLISKTDFYQILRHLILPENHKETINPSVNCFSRKKNPERIIGFFSFIWSLYQFQNGILFFLFFIFKEFTMILHKYVASSINVFVKKLRIFTPEDSELSNRGWMQENCVQN